jgi:hypothetical protein
MKLCIFIQDDVYLPYRPDIPQLQRLEHACGTVYSRLMSVIDMQGMCLGLGRKPFL